MTAVERVSIIPAQSVSIAPDPFLQMIERAASDPDFDLDRFERLTELRQKEIDRRSKIEFDEAFAAMQSELPEIKELGEIKIKENSPGQKYARWEDINQAIKPVLSKYGFGLSFRIEQPEGRIVVTGILARGGHTEQTSISLPLDTSGSKNNVQGYGSSTSYGKRYTAAALLNLTSRGEDDDGKAAGAPAAINEDQIGDLTALMESVGANKTKFLQFFKIEQLTQLPAKRFQEAVNMLNAKSRG